MALLSANAELHETIQQRAKEIFREHQEGIYKQTDRLFAQVLIAQWIVCILVALIISPMTWAGRTSQTHFNVMAAIFLGGAITSFPVYMAFAHTGHVSTRHTIAAAQMMMSGLLIHLTHGRIETHFHIFGSLAFLAFYRDWRVLVPATVVTAADHVLRGLFWPESIYGVLSVAPWRPVEHIGWVLFIDVFLISSCLRSVHEMRSIAWHTAQLETANHVIETRVLEQTAEAKASEEKFRILMDGVKDYAIIMLDPQGHVISWNEGAKRILGYLSDEVLGQHFSLFHTDEDLASGKTIMDIETAATFGRYEDEGWRVRQDGSRFWANVVWTALYDEDGGLRGFSKVNRDITSRRQAEDTLRRAYDELEQRVEERTAELAEANTALQDEIQEHQSAEAEIRLQNTLLEAQGEAAIEGILVVSAEGQISSHNQRFAQMWGMAAETLNTRSFDSSLQEMLQKVVEREEFAQQINSLHENHEARNHGELTLHTGNIFEYYSAPLRGGDGTYYGRIWFYRDITEAKKAAEALEAAKVEAERANAAKSEFLSRMSHELRTPMNAILGFGQLLEWDELTANQSQSVAQILKGGRHLLALINEVLEISRIEAGHMTLSLEPVNMRMVLREGIDLVAPLAAQDGIIIKDEALLNCSHIVMADQQRLKQVILNLLSNAIKYNHSGGRVTVVCEVREGGLLRLGISDTGPGIAAENIKKLFVPFERLGAERTKIEGNGIGLSLSRQLIKLMGGDIGVVSTEGQGSTFWIDLTLGEESTAEMMGGHSTPYSKGDVPEARPTILYIEDNLSNLNLIESVLDRHFHTELLSAMQGSLGLQLAREHRPDLILLDLHLPDIMGDQVLMQLRADSVTEDIPIVILSADATERQIEKLLEMGAQNYLTKPLDVNHFLQVLEQNLKRRNFSRTK